MVSFDTELGVFTYLAMSSEAVAIYFRFSAELKPRIALNRKLQLPENRILLAQVLSSLAAIENGIKWEETKAYPVLTTILSDLTYHTRLGHSQPSSADKVPIMSDRH